MTKMPENTNTANNKACQNCHLKKVQEHNYAIKKCIIICPD